MKLTAEQSEIIQSTGDLKINAVAGSGKTTTIIEYAKARPKCARILYLAFNRAVKLEAARKFARSGLFNVQVETAHSLAYRRIVSQNNYQVRPQGYKIHEIAELLGLKASGDKHAEYIVANHINKFIAYFCNSDQSNITDLRYLDVVSDPKARAFVTTFYDYIENQARLLLRKMDQGEIEITHDFYLKKFQLSNPKLNFDYILFDEGQDASSAMLDVFLKQKATKIIVGDTHQQIYGWRYAVNSLEKTGFQTLRLSTSFRFNQNIADLAMGILKWKNHLGEIKPVVIRGQGTAKNSNLSATLGRTNLGLLRSAITSVIEEKKIKRLYFEGNINSYTYADEGASLYDVLHLKNGEHYLIKDKLIRAMKDLAELQDYVEKTDDLQLGMMVDIVKKYGDSIPDMINTMKEKHVADEAKETAEMIFSTVHRCKGMEYDSVYLVNDFITEEKIKNTIVDFSKDGSIMAKLNEEINLLYVAVTRTKNKLQIPQPFIPKDFPPSSQIQMVELSSESKSRKAG
jgi:superfamily I DNA/RNA helicase